jgi:hypothetical protein
VYATGTYDIDYIPEDDEILTYNSSIDEYIPVPKDWSYSKDQDAWKLTSGTSLYWGELSGPQNVTPSSNNIVIGELAGGSMYYGYNNVYIGEQAGWGGSGGRNVSIGYRAGRGNGADNQGNYDYCVFIGAYAGNYNEGDHNVAIGRDALYNNLTGIDNLAVGRWALRNTRGNYNVGLGSYAGDLINTGSNNICIGYQADVATSDQSNTCIIGGTGGNAVNVGIGGQNNPQYQIDVTGDINITGDYRVNGTPLVFGDGHTHSNKANLDSIDQDLALADRPSFAGIADLSRKVSDTQSVMIGDNVGNETYLDTWNYLIGTNIGGALNWASGNVAIGYYASNGMRDAFANVVLGYIAGPDLVDGSNNIFIGQQSGRNNDNVYNVMIGDQAGARISGRGNTCIGTSAGLHGSINDIDDNTMIGYGAGNGYGGNTGLFLGRNATPSTSNDNVGMLGGVGIYAINVGINNDDPQYRLDVGGDINCSGVYRAGGTAGVTGTFTTTDGKTISVTNGIVTSIV